MSDPGTPRWAADIAVDLELAGSLLAERFPDLSGARIEPLGEGWDNYAFLVHAGDGSGPWVFRFPRRKAWAYNLPVECEVLPRIADRLPLPIPRPVRVGPPTRRYPWTFAGYRYLPGRPAIELDLDDEHRAALAAPMGRFLRALHAIDAREAQALGAPPDPHPEADLEKDDAAARARLAAFAAQGIVSDPDPVAALLDATAMDWQPEPTALVHGDFDVGHLLVDDSARLTGVIDWGDVHRGDPVTDLAGVASSLPTAAHASFREAYGPIEDDVWLFVRTRAARLALWEIEYGRKAELSAVEREGRGALVRLTSPP